MLDYMTLRRVREMKNVSQNSLAKELGCSRNYISMIENGNQAYTEEKMKEILKAIYKLSA